MMQILNLDIPELIRTNKYYSNISSIINYENSLEKIFSSNVNSQLVSNPYIFLWKINMTDNFDLFPNLKFFSFNDFGINLIDSTVDLVITGPYIRSHINYSKNSNIRKEIYVYKMDSKKWKNIIDLKDFTDEYAEYILETENFKICLIKKVYKSPSHILLQDDFIKRICWINGNFFVSSMFLIEYQKHINLINTNFRDPIFKIPYDPLDYCVYPNKNILHPIKIIEQIDLNLLLKIRLKQFENLYEIKVGHVRYSEEKKTSIEYALEKYVKEDHPILKNELKQIIIYLLKIKYKRPIILYALYLKIDFNDEIYKYLCDAPNKYEIIYNTDNIKNITVENIEQINMIIIDHCIRNDNPLWLKDYVKYIGINISKEILNLIIKFKANNIIKYIIKNNLVSKNLIYYLVLNSQELDMIKLINFDVDIAINYLKEIVSESLIRSFYFLYKVDESIINFPFENKQNLLHIIKFNDLNKKNTQQLINLIYKLKYELINQVDEFNETPIIYHAKNNPLYFDYFIDCEFDCTILDNDNNTFLHHLCKINIPHIIKKFIVKYPELLNIPNNKSETPIIISCINNLEDVFYVLKNMNANLDAKDLFGNTLYHYICKNSMCLSMMIENTKNNFGLTPSDYCQISPKYYNFI
jgi:hypothetical protein